MRRRRSVTVPLHQICPRSVHRCTAVFQTAGVGALPASGTIGPRCPSGRVGFQVRPGGCESLRTCQFLWRLSRSSDGAWLKTTRARRKTASLHHFNSRKRRVRRRSHKPAVFRATRNPAPTFSERSLEVRHSAWDRDHACANHAAPTNFFQVCGSVSGAPAREAGEAGAIPAHLTTARGDEGVESALCRREVSRCKSDHERQFRGVA